MAKHSVQRKRKKRGNSFSFGRAVVLVLCFIGVSFGLYLWQAAFSIGQPTPTVDDEQLVEAGIAPDLIRLSVGFDNVSI